MNHKNSPNISFIEFVALALQGGLVILGFCWLCLLIPLLVDQPGRQDFAFSALFVSPLPIGLIGLTMLWYRRQQGLGLVDGLLSLFLWSVGAGLLSSGFTAMFIYDEPNQWERNFWFSLFLCLLPGLVTAGAGLLLYFWLDIESWFIQEKSPEEKTPEQLDHN